MIFFDAHLDLACLAVNGRDMHTSPEKAGGLWQPGGVTLPSLREGNVRVALATIFTEPDGKDAEGYPAGDVERAFVKGRAQLEVYLTWRDRGDVAIDLRDLMRVDAGVGAVRAGMGVAEALPQDLGQRLKRADIAASGIPRGPSGPRLQAQSDLPPPNVPRPLHIGILVENADPIRSPDELEWWKERGVIAIGLAWAKSSRYANGNMTPLGEIVGLTNMGRAMVKVMDALGVVHDVSHLSDRAMDELFLLTDRPVMASHSNCRGLLNDPGNQRHLRDESIREIVRRGGVIGLNLCRNFIAPRPYEKSDPRPTVDQALAHVEHICEIVGGRGAVGLGSDMDGGFSALEMLEGVEKPADLVKLVQGLRGRGWSEKEVEGFAWGNWVRFWEKAQEFTAETQR